MRILHVITTLVTGGAERLMVDLLPCLNRNGHQVELLLFNGVMTPFRKELEQQGVAIHELMSVQGNLKHTEVYKPINIIKLRHFFEGYDVIHTHNTACQFYVPLAKYFTRYKPLLVSTEHNTTNRRRLKWWFRPLDKWMYRQYASIVCISDKAYENLVKYLGASYHACVINNGVDVQHFMRPIKDISRQSQYVVTMVAAFRPQKDHETVLKSFKYLGPNYRLQLVGDGVRCLQVKHLCRDLGLEGRVDFLGVRQDVPNILEQSDIIVLSSHWEGLSLSSIEGMATGRPFIASDVDGLHEIVNGAGILFPHGDDRALADAIMKLCENPIYYRQVAMACQERAQRYDISVMADAYMHLYESLVSNN